MVSDADLFAYVKYGNIDSYKREIKNFDINIRDKLRQTLLHNAIAHNQDVIAIDLLKRGIDVNIQDYRGQTVLHYIGFYMENLNLGLVEKIIKKGANIEIKDIYGNTPLWYAVHFSKGNYDFVQLLIKHGANSLSKNNVEKTPLDIALRIGNPKLFDILGYDPQ